jgi:hypothetical protein
MADVIAQAVQAGEDKEASHNKKGNGHDVVDLSTLAPNNVGTPSVDANNGMSGLAPAATPQGGPSPGVPVDAGCDCDCGDVGCCVSM